MLLKELAASLGISEYPSGLEAYYPVPEGRKEELCSLSLIDSLQKKFNIFGDYYAQVREGFADLRNDPARKLYMDALSLYLKDRATQEARELTCPVCVSTPASRMMPLFIHLPSIENTCRDMSRRGFSEEEVRSTLAAYRIYLWEAKEFREGFAGISPAISRWMVYFTKGEIFYPGFCGLNYQIAALDKTATPFFLKNRKTGQLVPVFGNGLRFHKSGIPLGSAGAKEEAGAFEAVFEETDSAYLGHCVESCRVRPERNSFSKEEWEIALRPGDDVICIHLFWKTDLTPETVEKSLEAGREIAQRCYPERKFKAFYCSSWILNPVLNEILGEKAKISAFSSRFVRYPAISAGEAALVYGFPGKFDSLAALPEETSLQRGLKKRILNGEYIYDTRGVILL